MDLWDLTKVLLRRWYIAVPMLLVSVGAVAFTSLSVKPDYSASGSLLLIPPAVATSDTAGATGSHVKNPWEDLGYNALGRAAMIKVQNHDVLEELVAEGYTDSFTVAIEDRSPLLSVAAVGHTAAQASGTVAKVISLLQADVIAEQKQYGVPQAQQITTLVLDKGDNVTTVTSTVKRVLIAAAGVGLLVTSGATIGIDALLRRRARRRASPDDESDDSGEPPARGTTARGAPDKDARSATRGKERPRHSTEVVVDSEPTVKISDAMNGAKGEHRPVRVEYRYRGSEERPVDSEPEESDAGVGRRAVPEVAADDTIVLPLARVPWARDEKRKRN